MSSKTLSAACPQSNAALCSISAASVRRYLTPTGCPLDLGPHLRYSSRTMPSSPSGFRVESRELDDCFVVDCHGRLTGENAPLLRDEVRALIPRHKSILIDLQDVPMLDSSGLGAIAG